MNRAGTDLFLYSLDSISDGILRAPISVTSFPFISRGIIIFVLCPVYSVIDSVPSSFIELSWYSKIVTPLSSMV